MERGSAPSVQFVVHRNHVKYFKSGVFQSRAYWVIRIDMRKETWE